MKKRTDEDLPSAIMPDLPETAVPELTAEDRLVVLLASAAQAGGRLSPSAWKKASDALIEVFGPERSGGVAEHDAAGGNNLRSSADVENEHRFFILQTRFHAALLREPLLPEQFEADRRIADDLASLSPERASRFLAALQELSPPHAEIVFSLLPGETSSNGAGRTGEDDAGWNSIAGAMRRSARFFSGDRALESVFGPDDADTNRKVRSGIDSESRTDIVMDSGLAVPRSDSGYLMPEAFRRQFSALSSAMSDMMSEAGTVCGDVAGSMAQAAVNQYQGASRYLRELSMQRKFSLLHPQRHEGELTSIMGRASEAAESLESAALEAGCLSTARNLEDLRHLMMEQPFTLVVVGEGKRGKSSLINALLGRAVSPVRESVPETAAVARFRWGREFRASVRFLSEQECQNLGQFFQAYGQESCERVSRLLRENPPQEDRTLGSEESLRDFLSAAGTDSLFTARVDVELPSEALSHGLILVDTPGLNATDPIQNYLAFEECLAADCLLFVMDARRPESASEKELIRQLAQSGRAASVIGVLTGVDRLNEASSREDALARAHLLMDAAKAGGMTVLGLVELNARLAMEIRCSESGDAGPNFKELCEIIEEASRRKSEREVDREKRICSKGAELAAAVRCDAAAFLASVQAELPDTHHTDILRRHVERLESVAQACSSQAWSVVNAAALDMEAWRKEQGRALDSWQERTLLRIMDAANKYADSLGFSAMFRPKNWKAFDEEEVPRIARECLEELLAERRDIQHDWNEKLRQFGQRMQEISVLCLDAVLVDDMELQSISDVPFSRERWLVNANSLMKKAGLVAMGLAIRRGGGLGLGIVIGNMGWWALLPAAVLGSLVWTLMKLGSPSRCRRLLMERKEEAVRRWTEEQRKRLDAVLNENLRDISQAYGKAVNDGFVPALSVLVEEASALRVYLDVLDRMRSGAEAQAAELVSRADRLEKELLELAPAQA